ncbi:hypothetical protein [Chroococcidiopsis sp.]|uniref:hypothetical protein n=1 Tax=Chroococcidiopsis sp. TaxID=3088168 RepID=UPI003F33B062
MSNPNPKIEQLKPYQAVAGDVQLAEQPLAVRVNEKVDSLIRKLPNKAEWMRRVLTEAAERELLQEFQD